MLKRLATMAAGLMIFLAMPTGAAFAQTVTTIPVSDNSASGTMFDVVAANDVTVTELASTFDTTPQTVRIYTRSGTWVGFSGSSAGWTLVGTATLTGTNAVQSIPAVLSVAIPSGQTQAFYIAATGTQRYRNGTAVGAVAGSDANLQILEGAGRPVTEFDNTVFQPRVLVGSVTYVPGLISVAPVPTMTEWAMILFALLLAGGAAAHLQYRRRSI